MERMRDGWDVQDYTAGATPFPGHVCNFNCQNNMKLLFSFYRRFQEPGRLINMPGTHTRELQTGRNTQLFYLISKPFLFPEELKNSLDILNIMLNMEIWFYVMHNKIIKLMNSTEGNLIYLRGRFLRGKQFKVPLCRFLCRGLVSVLSQQHISPGCTP